MIGFVQSFGINDIGGGSRILRALIPAVDEPLISISTNLYEPKPTPIAKQIHIPRRPLFGRMERTRFSGIFNELTFLLEPQLRRRLEAAFIEYKINKVHSVAHEIDFWSAYKVCKKLGIPYYLTVHDHILETQSTQLKRYLDCMGEAWQNADGIAVICQALGKQYCQQFGDRKYTIITDGWTSLPDQPKEIQENKLAFYFMGLVHWEYRTNFESFGKAIELLKRAHPTTDVSFVVRGTTNRRLLPSEELTLLPWGTEADVNQDMNTCNFLYMPMPFEANKELFARYSLSTKMVTYLASGIPIVYHGPAYAECCRLLKEHQAAIICDSNDPAAIAEAMNSQLPQADIFVRNALSLAAAQFKLTDSQAKFKDLLAGRLPAR